MPGCGHTVAVRHGRRSAVFAWLTSAYHDMHSAYHDICMILNWPTSAVKSGRMEGATVSAVV